MPWQDDPVVEQATWQRDPIVPTPPPEAPDEAQPEQTFFQKVAAQTKRQAGLGGRMLAEGIVDTVAPFADAVASVGNLGLAAYDKLRPPSMSELITGKQPSFRFPEQSQAFSQQLTALGVPEPGSGVEQAANFGGRVISSGFGSAPMTKAVMARLGFPASAPKPPANSVRVTSENQAGQTLQKAGVPLDKSQAQGGRFMKMLRSAVTNHPMTAGKQAEFSTAQQKAFNRAVLRSIGEDSSEATQDVMNSARTRIGKVFDGIGKNGAAFDDTLQSRIAEIVDDAQRTVTESNIGPLLRNVDDILGAVDDSGRINGEKLIQIRSRLSQLARTPGVGPKAAELHDALIGALERTYPGQKRALQDAVDQWRNLRIIQSAIAKGTSRDISPLRLSNTIASKANQNMSVFGLGGDQGLVNLAQAGRDVLPQALPDSGTVPRGLMQAPLRAIATAPLYAGAQRFLLSQPAPMAPPGMVNALLPGTPGAIQNAFVQDLMGQ